MPAAETGLAEHDERVSQRAPIQVDDPIDAVLAGVAGSRPVDVLLVGIGELPAVVGAVGDPVSVVVGVAGVAVPVSVCVLLARVRGARTVVAAVAHPVAVDVGVAGVAHAISVVISLRVRDRRAVVRAVGEAVPVGVGTAAAGRCLEGTDVAGHAERTREPRTALVGGRATHPRRVACRARCAERVRPRRPAVSAEGPQAGGHAGLIGGVVEQAGVVAVEAVVGVDRGRAEGADQITARCASRRQGLPVRQDRAPDRDRQGVAAAR